MVQQAIDTRALELASEAKADAKHAKEYADQRVRAHETLCAERHTTLNKNIADVGVAIKAHADSTDSHFKILYGRWWGIIGGCAIVAVSVIGFLFVKAYG